VRVVVASAAEALVSARFAVGPGDEPREPVAALFSAAAWVVVHRSEFPDELEEQAFAQTVVALPGVVEAKVVAAVVVRTAVVAREVVAAVVVRLAAARFWVGPFASWDWHALQNAAESALLPDPRSDVEAFAHPAPP
jgi:hypothetical protein